MRLRRPILLCLIAAAAVGFVLVSLGLARALSVGGAESSAVTVLVKAEARGDAGAVRRALGACAPAAACDARAAALAGRLRRPGTVHVLTVAPSSSFALGGGSGVARVAWRAGSGPAVIQCARIRRTGNVVSGMHVGVVAIGNPIAGEAGCPGA